MINEYRKTTINGKEYPIKFSQSVIGRLLRSNNKKLKDFNEEAMQDLLLLTEFVYKAVAYACRRTGVKFEHTLESFTDEIDDDPEALERSILLYADSVDTKDEIIDESPTTEEDLGEDPPPH